MTDCVCNTLSDRHSGVGADVEPATPAWMAVFSLAMGVFGLLTAEYLPASLLTLMSADLGVSEALGWPGGNGDRRGGAVRWLAGARPDPQHRPTLGAAGFFPR